MNIGVIGLGLIGGSMARDLKLLGHHICGYDLSTAHIEKAVDLKIVDSSASIEGLSSSCDFIIVSVPVNHTVDILTEVLDAMPWSGIVIDTASTKASICLGLKGHPKRSRFVASHPLAGTEFSGPRAAIEGLFKGKKNIICEEFMSDDNALEKTIELLNTLGLQTIFMDPVEHDKHMAYVSHLSHVSAFTLGQTVLDIEKDEKQIFNLASTGFESTVRLAKSSPNTWSSIFADNSVNLVTALEAYIDHLRRFKKAIEKKDQDEIKSLIEEANNIKRVLNGMKFNIVKLS